MVDILLGLQWGDEGKGKIVDVLAPNYSVVARFQGGPNAGHTLEFDGNKHVLHQIPSGIFRSDCINIIGNGVVLDPIVFKIEIEGLKKYNINFNNLFISKKAALIIPTHRILDQASEESKGESKIGSTLKGIGPTYSDKTSRNGLRLGDILLPNFKEKYEKLKSRHIQILNNYDFTYEIGPLEKTFFEAIEFLKTFNLVESEYQINEAIDRNQKILAEGAQGSLLDIDFGSYPFVTSSNTTAAGVCSGLGVSPKTISEVYGIFKAYCTRVGGGPFPTELKDENGEKMQKQGNEFGSTTGRARRCGWLDLPSLKYSIMLNGVTQLIMMKADVLNEFESIEVCTHYLLANGEKTNKVPFEIVDEEITPVYHTMKGWNTSLENISDYNKLPQELKDYVSFIETEVGVPITFVSKGPDRTETIKR